VQIALRQWVKRLMTVPSVGPVVALIYRAIVDVPAHFLKSFSTIQTLMTCFTFRIRPEHGLDSLPRILTLAECDSSRCFLRCMAIAKKTR